MAGRRHVVAPEVVRLRPAVRTYGSRTMICWSPLEPSGNGVALTAVCTSPSLRGRADRERVLAGLGLPGQVPLPPVVVAGRRAELGGLPGAAVDLDLDLVDAAVLRPGDAADEGVAGVDLLERLRGVDPAGDLDRGVGRPVALGPVGVLLVVRRQRHPGQPLGGADEAVEPGHHQPHREAVLAGQRLAVHADRDHRVAAVRGQVERRADGEPVDVGAEDLVGAGCRRRPGRAGR